MTLVEKIVSDSLKLKRDFHFLPIWIGEPFLHPQISQIINYITTTLEGIENFKGTIFHTNAVFLNEKLIREIATSIRSATIPFDIVFSIDAFKRDTYKSIKGIDALEKVIENIKMFFQYLNDGNTPHIRTAVQFLVFKNNLNQVKPFIDFWKKIYKSYGLDAKVIYDPYSISNDTSSHRIIIRRVEAGIELQETYETLHKKALHNAGIIEIMPERRIISIDSQINRDHEKMICPAPFKFLVIDMKGNITFCWKDKNSELSLGKIHDKSLFEILSSSEYIEFAKSHLSRDLSGFPICQKCNNFDAPAITPDEEKIITSSLLIKNKKNLP
ncbi:SPASM domain-containing protein [bacterium]|nr:SPASM domain-containing protein [bacterium]